jgi:hypothetical protein
MNEFTNNNLMGVAYMFSGIYDIYPGGTTRPNERSKEHEAKLKNGHHPNENFQQAVNQHGLKSFLYIQREPVPFAKLAEEERKLYDEAIKAGVPLLSKQRPPSKAHPVGYKLSERTRRKQSRAKRGNKNATKSFVFLAPDGTRVETLSLTDLCKRYDLDISCMSRVANRKRDSYHKWRKA